MNKLAPIILFVYNRPEHTKKTVESLMSVSSAFDSVLYIFSDGAKNKDDEAKVLQVRNFIKLISGFKKITIAERGKNLGLANSVINGINEVFRQHDKAIVLEDDLVFSKSFLTFMNAALDKFQNVENVFSISGYNFPINIPTDYKYDIYLSQRASSWGWATWKDRWLKADWNVSDFNSFIKDKNAVKKFNEGGADLTRMLKNHIEGKIDSWAVRWSYTHFKNNAFCVYPVKSKVQNIGMDSSGLHSIITDKFYVDLDTSDDQENMKTDIYPDERILKNFEKFFKFALHERLYWRIKRRFKLTN